MHGDDALNSMKNSYDFVLSNLLIFVEGKICWSFLLKVSISKTYTVGLKNRLKEM